MNSRAAAASTDNRKFGTIEAWCVRSGMGRTVAYGLLKQGKLRAVKCGKRTLIDFEHGDAYMAKLPPAYPIAA